MRSEQTEVDPKPAAEDDLGQQRSVWVAVTLGPAEDGSDEAGKPTVTRSGMLDDWRGVDAVPIPRIKIKIEVGAYQNTGVAPSTSSNPIQPKPGATTREPASALRDGSTDR
jgi:hypothetical protein